MLIYGAIRQIETDKFAASRRIPTRSRRGSASREETIKIGVNTWVWTSPFSTKEFHLIPKVRQMGFDVLEVALDDASIIDGKLLRKMTEDNGLSVTVCGAFGPTRDISNEDPSFRPNPGY